MAVQAQNYVFLFMRTGTGAHWLRRTLAPPQFLHTGCTADKFLSPTGLGASRRGFIVVGTTPKQSSNDSCIATAYVYTWLNTVPIALRRPPNATVAFGTHVAASDDLIVVSDSMNSQLYVYNVSRAFFSAEPVPVSGGSNSGNSTRTPTFSVSSLRMVGTTIALCDRSGNADAILIFERTSPQDPKSWSLTANITQGCRSGPIALDQGAVAGDGAIYRRTPTGTWQFDQQLFDNDPTTFAYDTMQIRGMDGDVALVGNVSVRYAGDGAGNKNAKLVYSFDAWAYIRNHTQSGNGSLLFSNEARVKLKPPGLLQENGYFNLLGFNGYGVSDGQIVVSASGWMGSDQAPPSWGSVYIWNQSLLR